MRRILGCGLAVIAVVLTLVVGVAAKGPTVRLTITGAGLTRVVEVTNPKALVSIWDGARSSESWFDFPKPFIAGLASSPDASLPRYTISFHVRTFGEQPQTSVLYVVRYVPDPTTGLGYVYLPGQGDPEYAGQAIVRHGRDGRWNMASAEWSSAINAQLAAALR